MGNNRLLELAYHLDSIEETPDPLLVEVWIQWPENHLNIWYAVRYNISLFKDLPLWFEEWSLSKDFQEPGLFENEDAGFSGGCREFFNLSPKEFSHLFDTDGYQNTRKYGGNYISEFSPPSSLAFNIREFVKRRV